MTLAQLPVPPVDTPVDRTGQVLMTVGTVAGLVILSIVAARLSRAHRTWTPALIPLSTLIAGLMQPLPDATANMWYYAPGQVTLWTSFGVALPVWVFLSYTAFYGGFGLVFWWLVETGATRARFIRALGAMWGFAVVTEVVGIHLGVYEYYGPFPFRLWDFPVLPISLINVTIVATIGVGAARLRRWLPLRERVLPALFLGPAVIVCGLVGCFFPVLNVIHTVAPNSVQLYGAALLSLFLTACMLSFTILLVPVAGLSPIGLTPDPQSQAASGSRT